MTGTPLLEACLVIVIIDNLIVSLVDVNILYHTTLCFNRSIKCHLTSRLSALAL